MEDAFLPLRVGVVDAIDCCGWQLGLQNNGERFDSTRDIRIRGNTFDQIVDTADLQSQVVNRHVFADGLVDLSDADLNV